MLSSLYLPLYGLQIEACMELTGEIGASRHVIQTHRHDITKQCRYCCSSGIYESGDRLSLAVLLVRNKPPQQEAWIES